MEKKLAAQAKAIALLGLDIDVFFFSLKRQVQHKGVHSYAEGLGLFPQLLSVLYRYRPIARHVDTDQYDFLVLRYSGGDFSVFSRFFRDNGLKIVTEHHTKELPEAYTYESAPPQKAITVLMERFLGPRMIRTCTGLIGVTDEIKEYELDRAGSSIPACTIPNGILVQDIPFSGHAPYDGKVLNLLCLANSFEAWQGLDRVLAGLQNYSSAKPFLQLAVVGNVSPQHLSLSCRLRSNAYVKVDFLGRLYGPALEELFGVSHMAFSSLALFRKGMKEACALKTREFMARGLPFVIGYHDPDLDEIADEFFLPVSADDSPVNIDEVVAFAERILNQKGVSESMREFAEKRLDWKIKIQQMWDFLESISRRKNPVAV